ncbi:MAG: hypothetical protein LBQ15_11060 [Clostridium sp.]|jgi:hypothetical protein|nr:hypothetical protein [Clostridium sp.]
MPWIQIDTGIKEHDKIYNLADALKITNAHAVGLMVCFWTWAVVAAPDGDITNFPPRALASAAGWEKKPETFFDAIRSEKSLFAEQRDGRWILRNWDIRAEFLLEIAERTKEQTRKRVQRYRDRKSAESPVTGNGEIGTEETDCNDDVTPSNADVTRYGNEGCNADVTVTNPNVTPLPNLTLPNQTLPNLTRPLEPPIPPASGGSAGTVAGARLDERFEEFWAAYPRKVGKDAAKKSWRKIKPDKALRAKIIAAIERAKQSEQWSRDNGQYIPNPLTWLNQGRWDDELDPEGGEGNGRAAAGRSGTGGTGPARPPTDPGNWPGFRNALDRHEDGGDDPRGWQGRTGQPQDFEQRP